MARSGNSRGGSGSGGGRGSGGRGTGGRGTGGQKRYPRVARVNEALREVVAETLEELDDERLELVTVTGVQTDPDLRHAHVYYSALTGQTHVADALAEHRVRLQAAIARQMHLKRTPQLDFRPDPAIIEGLKIDAIIATMPRGHDEPGTEPGTGPGTEPGTGPGTEPGSSGRD